MKSFLDQAAELLLQSERPLHHWTVVMPSRRAAIFLKAKLSEKLDGVALAPAMLTIEELVLESTGLQVEEPAALLFKAYEAYCAEGGESESFAEFVTWAPLLVNDCNEIDRYLVPAEKLFDYLGDIKRIEHWNLEPEPSEMVENYLALWRRLPAFYRRFRDQVLSAGRVYQGLAFRQMAEQMPQMLPQIEKRHQRFLFLGFNALNQAEEQILLQLWQEGLAEFLWDVDRYYFEDPDHEAGHFMRQSTLVKKLREAGQFKGLHSKLREGRRQVRSIAVAGNNLQAVVAQNLLAPSPEESLEHSALVLADEKLLPAVLQNIHPSIGAFNLTMGLSLKESPLAGFFDLLLRFQREAENGKGVFYHKNWDELLSHFVLRRINPDQVSALEDLRQKLQRQNAIYRSYDALGAAAIFGPLEAVYFEKAESPAQYFGLLARLSQKLAPYFDGGPTEALYGFFRIFNQLQKLLSDYPYVDNMETALRFYRELLPELSLDLYGEPLEGLQVMGMLETRSLDFKRLVICSLNEGILPKGRAENSLIPFEVKREYGLPTFLDKDAVYAYHFYRLLQEAENIDLLYSSSESGLGGGEASRFIEQLAVEWPLQNAEVEFKRMIASSEGGLQTIQNEKIPKSPAVMARLQAMSEKGLSPSALIKYLRNPLDFYYQNVVGLRENRDEIQEEPEVEVQGTVLHRLLENYYRPLDGPRCPSPEDPIYQQSKAKLRAAIRRELETELVEAELDQGINLLHLTTMESLLHAFLQQEKEQVEKEKDFCVVAVEEELQGQIQLSDGSWVKLRGFADRIDRVGGQLRIIDYKSGGKEAGAYRLKLGRSPNVVSRGWDALLKRPDSLQLLLYAYMGRLQYGEEKVSAAILSLRKRSDNPITMYYNDKTELDAEGAALLEEDLRVLLEELMNPEIPFQAREMIEEEDNAENEYGS